MKNKDIVKKTKVAIGRTFEPTGEIIEKGFNQEWGGYKFSDDEVELLLQGKELKVITENDKIVIGLIEKGKFKGHEFWAFQRGIPMKTAGHEWTDEERLALYEGEEVRVDDFYSPKNCEYFPATAIWDEHGREIILAFEDKENDEAEE